MPRFLHTADLQLGMPFHWIEGDPGAQVRMARFTCLETIGRVARDQGVAFIVIAGDLFDANTLPERDLVQGCDRLRALELPTYVLPGNHDHGGADSVYRSRRFLRHAPPNVTVLLDPAPRLHDERTLLLPAPLLRRHGVDPTAHLGPALGRSLAPDAVRVGLAHGSVQGFSSADGAEPNRIDPDIARRADLDYLALGDWHGCKEINPRTWYSGAPEPTAFKDNDPGHVLVVEVAGHGAPAEVERVAVARTRWIRHAIALYNADDLTALERWFDSLRDPAHTLVRLEVEGVLSLADLARLDELLATAGARLLHLRRRGEVLPAPTADELLDLAGEGWLKAAVRRLQGQAEGQDPAAARALRLLHRLRAEGG